MSSSSARSRVRSSLFTSDGSTGVKRNTPKRSIKQPPPTKGNENTNLVQISFSSIRESLREMAQKGHMVISNLDTETMKKYSSLVEIIDAAKQTNQAVTVLKMINEAFASYTPESIVPGSIAAHFVGCTTGDRFGGDPNCSAICAGSFQPEMINGYSPCAENVIHLKNGAFEFKTIVPNEVKATIHVFDDNFKSLTSQQIQSLKNEGITKVAIYHHGTDNYAIRQNHIDLGQLAKTIQSNIQAQQQSQSRASSTPLSGSSQKKSSSPSSSSSQWSYEYIAVGIVMVIVVLIVLWFGYSYAGSRVAPSANVGGSNPLYYNYQL